MWAIATDVYVLHGLSSICQNREPWKMAELIEIPFGAASYGSKEPCIRWGCILMPSDEYDWMIYAWWWCGLLLLLLLATSSVTLYLCICYLFFFKSMKKGLDPLNDFSAGYLEGLLVFVPHLHLFPPFGFRNDPIRILVIARTEK